MMKTLLKMLIASAAAVSINAAMAHGTDAAKHGGTVASAGDLGFELVSQADAVTLYVDDHGKPLSTAGMSGKLTVLADADKSEAELTATAPNKLEAKGLKLSPGAKAVAIVTLANKKVLTVRFAVKG